jgi:methylamine dehydrogenase accessory protein MauD
LETGRNFEMTLLMGSYFALWIVVVLLSLALAALARQIGVLYRRLPPAGARMGNPGPEVGKALEPFVGMDLYGETLHIPDPRGRGTALIFVSPGCSACEALTPALKAASRQEKKRFKLILVGLSGDEESNRAYVQKQGLSGLPFIVSPAFSPSFEVSATPYVVLVDHAGVVLSKGVVNRREHLDSILNSTTVGYHSIEAMVAAKQEAVGQNGTLGSRVPQMSASEK